jgi:hypothetical protein
MRGKDNDVADRGSSFTWDDLKAEIERQNAAQLASDNETKSASWKHQQNDASTGRDSFWQDLDAKGENSSALSAVFVTNKKLR